MNQPYLESTLGKWGSGEVGKWRSGEVEKWGNFN
jgi:hypothetical protein